MAERFAAWLVFSVVLVLLPVLFALSTRLTDGGDITVHTLLGGGELFLLTVAVCAAAAEELAQLRRPGTLVHLWTGSLFVIVGWSCFWYADVARAVRVESPVDQRAIVIGSGLLFGFAAMVRLSLSLSTWMAENRRTGGER